MNTVILSLCEPVDVFVINELEREFPIRAVIRPVNSANQKSSGLIKKLKKATPSRIATKLRSHFYRRYMVPTYTETCESLFPQDPPSVQTELIDVASREVNSDSTVELLRSLSPDLLLVCGAPLLKPEVFTVAKEATLNIHFGIAPGYRGIHTVFWPLYYHDYENIGVTLHHIDRGMDTGRVVAYGRPDICPDDTEGTLWASLSRVAAKVASEVLSAAERGADLTGHKQPSGGRKFFGRDRKIRHDLTLQLRRKLGAILPVLPEWMETFFVEGEQPEVDLRQSKSETLAASVV